MKFRLLFIAMVLFLTACVKETDWQLNSRNHGIVIVDGIITDEYKVQQIRLSNPSASMNADIIPVSGAVVVISDEDSSFVLSESPARSGIYKTTHPVAAAPGKHYSLLISFNNNIYSAKAQMVPGSPFPPLQYLRENDDSLYHLAWVSQPYNAGEPAMYEVLLDWSDVQGYLQMDSAQTHARMQYYTLPSLDVSEIFAPSLEQIRFPAGAKVIERRYSLTPEHAAFIRAMLLETQWQGGFFPVAAANVPTNLSPGSRGFFGICAVNSLSFNVFSK